MGRPQISVAKRLREQAKREKKRMKAEKRAQKKEEGTADEDIFETQDLMAMADEIEKQNPDI